ncbi:hypothetical protein VTO42DRAFT_6126 [Malbranchea cinnamomea]
MVFGGEAVVPLRIVDLARKPLYEPPIGRDFNRPLEVRTVIERRRVDESQGGKMAALLLAITIGDVTRLHHEEVAESDFAAHLAGRVWSARHCASFTPASSRDQGQSIMAWQVNLRA